MEDFNYEKQVRGKNKKSKKEEVREKISTLRQEGIKPVPGELLKTPEEIAAIDKINEIIADEFRDLGIEECRAVDQRRIHLLLSDSLQDHLGHKIGSGAHRAGDHTIFIDADSTRQGGRFFRCKVMLHEMLHAVSANSYDLGEDDESEKPFPRRNGYRMYASHGSYFYGFNEAITEKVTRELLLANKGAFAEIYNLTKEEEEKGSRFAHRGYRNVVDAVIQEVASYKGEAPEEVWRSMKAGMFTGEMMHLRDIEEVYGKGALRVIASMGSFGVSAKKEKEETRTILQYFETKCEEERDEIARDILNGHDYEMYKKRRKGA